MSEQSNGPQAKNLEPPVVTLTAADPNTSDWTAPSVLPLAAILGLVFLASFFAGLMVLEIWIVNEMQLRPRPFFVFALVMQTMLIPPMICYSFLIATIMFWYGSITLRFLGAFSAVLPSVTVFCVMFAWLESPPHDFVSDVALCLFACLLSSAAVALLYQMWTRWSLTHDRNNTDLPPTGIRSIIELTVICAVAAAFFSGAEIGDVAMGIAFFSIWGLLATLAVIRIQISFLQDADRDWLGIVVGCGFVFLVCLGVNYFFAYMEFGRSARILRDSAYFVWPLSLYGSLLVAGLLAGQIYWLRKCGWRCIDQSKRAKKTIDGDSISPAIDPEPESSSASTTESSRATQPHPLDT